MNFNHLQIAKQSYTEHFIDSFYYAFMSMKASICFLIHAIYPDICTSSGSKIITTLNKDIENKYKKISN